MTAFSILTTTICCFTSTLMIHAQKLSTVFAPTCKQPLVTEITSNNHPLYGLTGRHIAMWQSHGRYYEKKLNRWEWQRARLLQTVEDLYTQSYVLPFLTPMLENAGAYVLLPRERDCNPTEIIVDNDGNPFNTNASYTEQNGEITWQKGTDAGFAYRRKIYTGIQNPFKEGTYRLIHSIRKGKESIAQWTPQVPHTGKYAVYVAYKTLPQSTSTAIYTVYHAGGKSIFKVNQQMGGGTWIYLGTFMFNAHNAQHRITLSNITGKKGEIVTADAVKIGGGMGNIGRPMVSTYPRFTEGARYWMQWAGVPDSIYSPTKGTNDYIDDYRSRGNWVNWLCGGSESYPQGKGLNIPISLSLAFHSDAGTTLNDSTIGTLGIYFTSSYNSIFANGAPRLLCKEYAETIHNSILRDVRSQFDPHWSSRGNRNASYFEARVPRVPAMLLELLSHQNFADMRYGLDPRFRFAVSRAIYKGMLRFLSKQYQQKYVVTPLRVSHLSAKLTKNQKAEITWQPEVDSLEPTAKPNKYIVYTRYGNADFDNGHVVKKTRYVTHIPTNVVVSFKIVAMNKGGISFPSEIVAVGQSSQHQAPKALIVNGFNRISAPESFVAPAPLDTLYAGFLDSYDHGVPYMKEINYVGSQKEFNRSRPWLDDDSGGFGDSYGNEEGKVIAGNTFDYIALHGDAILKAGCSFQSCSSQCLTKVQDNVAFVDLILGKQYQTPLGNSKIYPLTFKTFTPQMQQVLTQYTQKGTSIMVSGAYVASDLWNNRHCKPLKADKDFATNILKYQWRNSRAALTGRLYTVETPIHLSASNYEYSHTLNNKMYIVESPDAIIPFGNNSYTVMRYTENNLSAAVAYHGAYSTFVMGVPFETIGSAAERNQLMADIVNFFLKKSNK